MGTAETCNNKHNLVVNTHISICNEITVAVNSDAAIYQRTPPYLQKIMGHKWRTKTNFTEQHIFFNGKKLYLLFVYKTIL
jgi:hypothetical protein